MIPPFDENGYLPPGIYRAALDEIAARFGQETEIRRAQMDSVRWMMDSARRAGVARVVIDGSFVTDTLEPNDVDCILLLGPDFPKEGSADAELRQGLPFLQLQFADQKEFDWLTTFFFATDRSQTPKGMVEVIG